MKPPGGMWTMLVTTPRAASSFRIWMRKSPRDPGISNCVAATPSVASLIGSAMPASALIGGQRGGAGGRSSGSPAERAGRSPGHGGHAPAVTAGPDPTIPDHRAPYGPGHDEVRRHAPFGVLLQPRLAEQSHLLLRRPVGIAEQHHP